jgi:predicted ATP-dependent serine protease
MLTLGQVIARGDTQGASIETPYRSLTRLGYTLRRGQQSMVAAAPGVGKSAFALDLVMKIKDYRSLYLCADTDPLTMSLRAAAKMTGHTQEHIEHGIRTDPGMASMYRGVLDKLWQVRFSFDVMSLEDVRDEVFAYATAHGAFPPIIVVDNLVNITEGDDEYRAFRHAVAELDHLARVTNAHVMVLHHSSGKYEDGDLPIPLGGLEYKVGKIPAQVLTLTRSGEYMKVHLVKNRGGKADPKCALGFQVHTDLATMTFREAA